MLVDKQPGSVAADEHPIDVFISYTSRDLQWAQWLAESLESVGYVCRYQHRDFSLGANFVAAMQRCIANSSAVLAVLSPAYEESTYCTDEWTAAHNDERVRLVPIRVEEYTPSGVLGTLAYLDLVGHTDSDAMQRLQTELQIIEPSGGSLGTHRFGRPRYSFPGRLHPVPVAGAPLLGRDDRLSELDRLLDERQGPVSVVPETQETAGTGCTALTADFVRSRADKYDTVCWIPSSPPELIDLEYWRLGRELGLAPPNRTLGCVNRELEDRTRRGRVLVVFDDAPPRGRVSGWLPSVDVDCLITSKSGSYRGQPRAVKLGPLTVDQAIHALSNDGRRDALSDLTRLADLVELRPRAVRLAAAYLRAVDVGVAELVSQLEDQLPETQVEDAIKQLALDRVAEYAPKALHWLAVLGFGAARPVPLNALSAPGGAYERELADALHPTARQTALDALTRLDLVYEVEDSIAIAGWVGSAARRQLPDELRDDAARAAVETFTNALARAGDRNDEELADQLAPHLWTAIKKSRELVPLESVLRARAVLGRHLSRAAAHDLAIQVISEGLEKIVDRPAPPTTLLVRARRDLAGVLRSAGDSQGAIGELDKARDDASGSELISILVAIGHLRAADADDREAAEGAFEEAGRLLAAQDAEMTEQSIELLAARTLAHEGWGEIDVAERLASERVDTATVWAGADAVQTTAALVDRGRLRRQLGRLDEAEQDLATAVSYMDDDRDEQLPDALVEMAQVFTEQNRPDDALLPLGRAAVVYSGRGGRECAEVASVLRRIADAYDEIGDSSRASAQRLRADGPSVEASDAPLRPQLDRMVGALKQEECTLIVGPDVTNDMFRSRDEIAQRWAMAEGYPLEAYRKSDLPNIAEYLSIVSSEDIRKRLMAHLVDELFDQFEIGLPAAVTRLNRHDVGALETVIAAVGALARWIDPFQHHAVLARLPIRTYIVAGPSDLLADALQERGKRPNRVICNWRHERQPGASSDTYDDEPSVDEPLVLHIFGHLAKPESIILTELDYIRFARAVSPQTIPHHVHRAIVDNSLMILGFRLHEWDFHMLFEGLINQPGSENASNLPSVAVNVSLEDRWENESKAREYVDRYFAQLSKRPVEILWEGLDDVIRQLAGLPIGDPGP